MPKKVRVGKREGREKGGREGVGEREGVRPLS
jgi:hypothetical protein